MDIIFHCTYTSIIISMERKTKLRYGRQSDGRARGSKGNARALQTNNEGSEPKIGWNWGPPREKFCNHAL